MTKMAARHVFGSKQRAVELTQRRFPAELDPDHRVRDAVDFVLPSELTLDEGTTGELDQTAQGRIRMRFVRGRSLTNAG